MPVKKKAPSAIGGGLSAWGLLSTAGDWPRAKPYCGGRCPDRGCRCPADLVRASAFLVLRGLREPDTTSGAAIGSQLGNIAITRGDARQAKRPRTDRTCRLQRVVIADRSHQVSECQHRNLELFLWASRQAPEPMRLWSPCRNFQAPELSNDRLKFKRMFQAEARKFDHLSSL